MGRGLSPFRYSASEAPLNKLLKGFDNHSAFLYLIVFASKNSTSVLPSNESALFMPLSLRPTRPSVLIRRTGIDWPKAGINMVAGRSEVLYWLWEMKKTSQPNQGKVPYYVIEGFSCPGVNCIPAYIGIAGAGSYSVAPWRLAINCRRTK